MSPDKDNFRTPGYPGVTGQEHQRRFGWDEFVGRVGEDGMVRPTGEQLALDADVTKCSSSPFTTPSDCSPILLDGRTETEVHEC